MKKPNKFVNSQSLNHDLQQAFPASQSSKSLVQSELDQVVGGGGIFGTDIIDWTYFKGQMLPHKSSSHIN